MIAYNAQIIQHYNTQNFNFCFLFVFHGAEHPSTNYDCSLGRISLFCSLTLEVNTNVLTKVWPVTLLTAEKKVICPEEFPVVKKFKEQLYLKAMMWNVKIFSIQDRLVDCFVAVSFVNNTQGIFLHCPQCFLDTLWIHCTLHLDRTVTEDEWIYVYRGNIMHHFTKLLQPANNCSLNHSPELCSLMFSHDQK